ncbi:chemotaxis protein CheB [Dyadobacter sp. CY261]|uniref:chemotaxis protein CheB n=1 Tax=Dyadobacter sp. CY261 TaxID=2907203 RepID=UPI001F312124|nr:chemotaxis protein CheB [Dyadobacter sp. CY261]MCF0069634.1 chemotaxis protein CheB [Dyadobacter sp. CY261]
MANQPRFIVVIGASAGGLNALAELVQTLPTGLDVAYCIVLHLSRKGIGDFVVHRLSKSTAMECSMAINGTLIEAGHIYVAPPNQHLLVKSGKILLGSGPQENRFRPSIDVLFRSAAVAYTSNAIGIILSGMLDDGTSGMWAIKRSGGTCIVQDPNQAEYPDMPLSVVNNMDVDYVIELDETGPLIARITALDRGVPTSAPQDVVLESQIAEKTAVGIDDVEQIGDKSVFACPDCGGNLWTVKGDIINRYRCHIGHSYTERDLVVKQAETASTTLWVALRMMEERKHLLRKLEIEYSNKGYTSLSLDHLERKNEMEKHIDTLKIILSELQNHDTALLF